MATKTFTQFTAVTTLAATDELVMWNAAAAAARKITGANFVANNAHSLASAAVHGLPASANVLGNRNAAGEFIQRGTATLIVLSGTSAKQLVITFPVAFSSLGGILITADEGLIGAGEFVNPTVDLLSTTSFRATVRTAINVVADRNIPIYWLAWGT